LVAILSVFSFASLAFCADVLEAPVNSNGVLPIPRSANDNEALLRNILDVLVSLNNTVTRLDSRLTKLEASVAELKVDFAELKVEIRRAHNLSAERDSFLTKCSRINTCRVNDSKGTEHIHFSTVHAVSFDSKIFSVGVKHSECHKNVPGTFECDGIDVVIISGCPTTDLAIDINDSVPLNTGDAASTFGYYFNSDESFGRYWVGTLAGKLGSLAKQDIAFYHPEEFIFGTVAQMIGMSGGATINSCGYTGVCHGNEDYRTSNATFNAINALVIPAYHVKQCAKPIMSLLKDSADCPAVPVQKPPMFGGECAY
jgi:hypothetical protein